MNILSLRTMNIFLRRILVYFSLICFSQQLWSGEIRILKMNDKKMQNIYLRMGQSTVLRFKERPQKVIIGNQNYFHVEFTDNDITLQPQGLVITNFFVYTKHHTYGFVLKVSQKQAYDDLVRIHWLPKFKPYRHNRNRIRVEYVRKGKKGESGEQGHRGEGHRGKKKEQRYHDPWTSSLRKKALNKPSEADDLTLTLGTDISGRVIQIRRLRSSKFYLMDIELQNISDESLKTSDLKIWLTRRGKNLGKFSFVFESDDIPPHRFRRCRILFSLSQKKGFTLHLTNKGGDATKVFIKRRFL